MANYRFSAGLYSVKNNSASADKTIIVDDVPMVVPYDTINLVWSDKCINLPDADSTQSYIFINKLSSKNNIFYD